MPENNDVKFAILEGEIDLVQRDIEYIKDSVDKIESTMSETVKLLDVLATIQLKQQNMQEVVNTQNLHQTKMSEEISTLKEFKTEIKTAIRVIVFVSGILYALAGWMVKEKIEMLNQTTHRIEQIEKRQNNDR
jgi:type III secretory pathway component EscS